MSKLRNAKGQFRKGHGKIHKKHHHKRRNPALGGMLARAGGAGLGAKLAGAGRMARVLIVR